MRRMVCTITGLGIMLADIGITSSAKSSTFFGTGMLGQVYLGNIKQYIRRKK